ncbi:uncharacterized protein LOC128679495 [Plodia interpunctella]|uniref:uncharacterized protein LOC128679495 n=1 Tax=Plodia interpunctella TaxID=58824 RepID=UPI002367AC6A|nr:uncharacterized protein LOC128679495 [Plodia interpunctella]
MGDLIELTTVPQAKVAFYKVPSGGLKFDIKGSEGAIIALAKEININHCDYLIVLGHFFKSWIQKSYKDAVVENTPNLLSPDEYRSFWILWDSQSIRVGKAGESNPFLCYKNVVQPLHYVTFAVKGGRTPISWRFELPPEIPRPQLKSLCGGEPRWVPVGNQLPHGAVIGGYENGSLYIIRANHQGALTPGKFVPSEGLAYIPWGSVAHEKEDFEVLVGYNYIWVASSEAKIPVGAVVGGFSEYDIREVLYIGRAKQGDHIIPGKVHPSHKVCYVPYEGRECAHREYEILVSLEVNNRCSNNIFYPPDIINTGNPRSIDSDEEME